MNSLTEFKRTAILAFLIAPALAVSTLTAQPFPPHHPKALRIDRNTPDPVGVLIRALADPTIRTIGLCDVDLDLTGHSGIVIGADKSLIAFPACARGPRRLGPRIFVTDTRGSNSLFEIRGDNVLFSGFRLEGPTSGIGQGDIKEIGILISPLAGADPIHSIEISNMEIFHWSGAGVEVKDNVEKAERGRLFNTNEGAVRIKGSFFHHNRHGAGFGYGVEVSSGAYALIEQNVFDENRHAIAGGSRNPSGKGVDFSGYTARDNLILSGGGLHSSESWYCALTAWKGPWCKWQTHQIDMHGDEKHWYSGDWNCGTAGETIIIERNTILYDSGNAIKIRGNPVDKAVVDGNVFKQSRSDAIAQNGNCGYGDNITNPIQVRPNNQFHWIPPAESELPTCDFVGDGRQDKFMATGISWWAHSPPQPDGTNQWRYLNTMSEKLSDVRLADIDGDGVCDVAPKTRRPHELLVYSKSGTSAWLPRGILP